ncbi:TetR/AcrR family transcriptional regulator [Nocardia sp. NPDC050406]|uniref:TetR/AcrR family transcriptional regulator n=1 Tax=Nocardia sp. NPDC050406 TaxID=3364318 RepID=UPI0037992500
MSTASDRRTLIVDSAIDVIAAQGLRTLTHRALDTALALPAGSTSYYFRTKRALIEAIVDRIHQRSRDDFAASRQGASHPLVAEAIAENIARWLDSLLAERRTHLITRHALIIDLLGDPELHARLMKSLFSAEQARQLFTELGGDDPDTAAADFLAVLEGLVFDRFAGARTHLAPGTPESITQLANALLPHLTPRAATPASR